MSLSPRLLPFFLAILVLSRVGSVCGADEPPATKEFEIRGDRPYLAGHAVDLWGLRCGNALYSPTVTERHVNNFDNMVAHGINWIGVSIQGCHGGWPNPEAGLNGYRRDGRLKPEVAARLEKLIREADKRGMVVAVQLFSSRKDQEFYDEDAIRRAVEETGRFLTARRLRNVFVDIVHTFDHADRADHALLREPDGAAKKAKLAGWFKAVAPGIEVGICSAHKSDTAETFAGQDIKIIQKESPIPSQGFVVNVETLRQDSWQDDGWFNDGHKAFVLADCERYLEAPNAVMLFHCAYVEGVTNFSGTAPHPEMGGYGTGPADRGVRFYYEWVRDHVGRYEFPRHVKGGGETAQPRTPTREFEIRDAVPYLGGEPVKLWGIRWGNALMSPAVTERHVRSLDTMAAHGINLISVSLQGTNGSFPSVDAGPNAYLPTGALQRSFADRLEWLVREADKRGMVVALSLLQPRKDQELRDESAVRRAIEETGRVLVERKLKNVFVNLMHEFSHPVRADHEILREPDGPAKKAKQTAWFKAVAPDIEVGICPNHQSGSGDTYPGMEVRFFQEEMPIPSSGFAVNTETHDNDEPGNEGVFNQYHRASMRKDWEQYLGSPRLAMIFHSSYGEGVTNSAGTGPNPEMGGDGTSTADRGVRFYFQWLRDHVGRWEFPRHAQSNDRPQAGR